MGQVQRVEEKGKRNTRKPYRIGPTISAGAWEEKSKVMIQRPCRIGSTTIKGALSLSLPPLLLQLPGIGSQPIKLLLRLTKCSVEGTGNVSLFLAYQFIKRNLKVQLKIKVPFAQPTSPSTDLQCRCSSNHMISLGKLSHVTSPLALIMGAKNLPMNVIRQMTKQATWERPHCVGKMIVCIRPIYCK